MQKTLKQILEPCGISNYDTAFSDTFITGLAFDSRKVKQGFLFFALPGVHVNGNDFILPALKNGAAAVIYQDKLPSTLNPDDFKQTAFIQVKDSRVVMAPVSDAFYDYPSSKLVTFGVTGTEGKSTTVSLLWQLLRLCGKKAGFISTVDYSLGGEAERNPEHQTTPEAPIVNEKLSRMIENGCEFAVVESSSHGLSKKLNRLGSVQFDAAAFMNVTHEHLEFHGTHEQYKYDKANLFRALDENQHIKNGVKVPSVAAVNLEDPAAEYFAEATEKEVIGFSIKDSFSVPDKIQTIFHASNIQNDSSGVSFTIEESKRENTEEDGGTFFVKESYKARINLPGSFNVYNALAALILVSNILNKPASEIAGHLSELKPVRGRMTTLDEGQPFEVIIDYAHTPSSFEAVFPPLRERAKGRIISLFGSGGERDTQKRPIQGEIAAKYSDVVILADEDPRGENPMDLLEDIAKGCKKLEKGKSLFLIPDRPKAIMTAFSMAEKNDIVLLLGKGHENSIIYKDHTMPYDEIEQALKTLHELGFKKAEA